MIVGWRKGDAASLMAQSAGGQAISLMCLCLKSLCSSEMFGAAMFDLSEKLLPKSLSISSITQLGDAESLVRVSGSQGMGHILAMALTMFPMATVLEKGLTSRS